jgi:hypothetical protein
VAQPPRQAERALAAGLKDTIGHAFDPLDLPHALFLVADALFRHTIPLRLTTSALSQLAAPVLVVAGPLLFETRAARA